MCGWKQKPVSCWLWPLVVLVMTGCAEEHADQPSTTTAPAAHQPADAHPTQGPHAGALIELGQEEYHAELVHDEASNLVTIYVWDAGIKHPVPIEAGELIVNLSQDGQPEQFALAASPTVDDPAGQSSRFTSTSPALAAELDHSHGDAHLVVKIAGKQYRGAIAHDHEH